MTDFEERLTSSLHAAGDDAPGAAGLAPAARARARSRRRRTALASAVGAVAVAAVVGGVALLGSGGDDGAASIADDVPTPAPATRVETWRDVSVTVPTAWGHGNLDDWCSSGESDGSPVVERPGAISIDILCTPTYGYGVQFSDVPSVGLEAYGPGTVNQSVDGDFPSGSWQGWDAAGQARVLVVAPTKGEAERVLGSFEEVKGADANGCDSSTPDDTGSFPAPGTLRLCRYAGDGWLEQSELLTGQDAVAAAAALDSAPDRPALACPKASGTSVLVTSADHKTGVVQLDTCAGLFGWTGVQHDLTGDILHWVLSPGWTGQVPDGITFQPRS